MIRFFHFSLTCFCLIVLCHQQLRGQTPALTLDSILVPDGGICSLDDTVRISGRVDAFLFQWQTIKLAVDFGDGNRDTLTYNLNVNDFEDIFCFTHTYDKLSTYNVTVKAIANNTIHDSTSVTFAIGHCQKASGTFFYDLNDNCAHDDDECGINVKYAAFANNGTPCNVYIEPITGKFSIPVYPGDSYLPKTDKFHYPNSVIGPGCVDNSYPAITHGLNNYKVIALTFNPVRPCLTGPTLSCTGWRMTYGVGISSNDTWYVKYDWGQGISELYATCVNDCRRLQATNNFRTPGIYYATVYTYNRYFYGPLGKSTIRVEVQDCQPVTLKLFSDADGNCVNDINEFQFDADINRGYLRMHSVKWSDFCPYDANSDGTVTAWLRSEDTVYPAPEFNYKSKVFYLNDYINFERVKLDSCGPAYFTNADDTLNFSYKGAIKILNLRDNNNNTFCVGDTLQIELDAASLGTAIGDPLRLIVSYSDGQIDTTIFTPPSYDTFFMLPISKLITVASANLSCQFVVQTLSGLISDTATKVFMVRNCAKIRLRAFYDDNRNCTKDANEPYLPNLLANGYVVDSTTNIYTVYGGQGPDTLKAIRLQNNSPLGGGYYDRIFTSSFCEWPVFGLDTGYFEIPLIDTVTVENSGLLNGYNQWPENVDMDSCEMVYHPTLKGNIVGNRNQSNQFYFLYNKGNGELLDSIPYIWKDNFSGISTPYYLSGPVTTYDPGTYIPGYKIIKNENADTIHTYVRPAPALEVLLDCQKPKAILYADADKNCRYTKGERTLSYVMVNVSRNGQQQKLVTNTFGMLYFDAQNGDQITITVPNGVNTGLTLDSSCKPATYSYTYNQAMLDTVMFAYTCGGSAATDVSVTAGHGVISPLYNDTLIIYPAFNNCDHFGGRISVTIDPSLTFEGASLAGYQQTGNHVSWRLDTLNRSELYPLKVAVSLNNPLASGYLCNEVLIYPNVPDQDSVNNKFNLCDTVFNHPMVQFKTGLADSIYLQTGMPIIYTVFFKNTTSDTIPQVIVVDTLSPLLNINSLQVLYGSHSFNTSMINNQVLKFTFPNINLAPGATGRIQFSLIPIDSVDSNTVIYNQATLVYGGNYMFGSGSASTKGKRRMPPLPSGIAPKQVSLQSFFLNVFPNPITDIVKLVVSGEIGKGGQVVVYDLNGRRVIEQQMSGSETQVDFSTLANGNYLIKYQDSKWSQSVKVTKSR